DGVRRSTDAGLTWTDYNAGLPYLITFKVCSAVGQSNKLYVSTYGGSIFTADQIVNSVKNQKSIPHVFSLAQNYPNPFNPSTQISYTIPKASNVTLKVFDILGQQMVTLVNGKQEPWDHSVIWNALDMPSGVYFYRIVAGDFVQTKKMILMK